MKYTVMLAALLATIVIAPAQQKSGPGWTTLFDGTNLDNWNVLGNANWKLDNKIVAATTGTGYLVSKADYTDFELHAEFWVDEPANSGVFLRCSNRTDVSQDTAYEVNIYDQRPDQSYATAAIVNVASAEPKMKAAGKWNTFDITAQGDHLVVTMNGTKTVDTHDKKYAKGPVALQHGAGDVRFRLVRIRPLGEDGKANTKGKR